MKPTFFQSLIAKLEYLHIDDIQSLRKEDFRDEIVWRFLLDHDLIELEESEDRYYLHPETYDLIENDELEDHLWRILSEEQRQEHLQSLESDDSRELSYSLVEPEKTEEKKPFLSEMPRTALITAFSVIMVILYMILPVEREVPEKGFSPGELKGLEEVTIIQDGDTLNTQEKEELINPSH